MRRRTTGKGITDSSVGSIYFYNHRKIEARLHTCVKASFPDACAWNTRTVRDKRTLRPHTWGIRLRCNGAAGRNVW
ncbi:hypothetical protein DOTSEDRAFT_69156 [Dothistroma septosporum NZE10]|uniref:Uncharacterized protein n=1 Tax=Dothistroma septosporum (strain NZE10 / CBS 128990) TaxID=675120 RepID=N1PUN7_DOTSN|nr:hypothetical protein DOTSEDRAFT_69156 [Dothistroma septosporum NZE10]